MKTKPLLLITILISLSIRAQIDFEPHIIVDSHPDVSSPYNLVSADIDGDGDNDIVATSTHENKVVWFENLDGHGNFSGPKVIVSNMDYPLDITVADIDGDGDLDIVAVSSFDHKIVWFENLDGLGNFGPQHLIASLHGVQTVQAKDMDGDGDIDIIAGGDNKVVWLENLDGLGDFGPEKIVADLLGTTESIEVEDIDGDGDMDVVVADWILQTVNWFENLDGMGTFGPARIITDEGDLSSSVVLKDLDNDGSLDAVSDYQAGAIAWFKNDTGQGNFGNANIVGSEIGLVYKIFSEDLNGNGKNDIITTIYDEHEIIWFENEGNGNFGNPHIIHSGTPFPVGIIAADFNGTGRMDVAACFFEPGKIMWFENKGSLGIDGNQIKELNVFPNPTEGVLHISSTFSISEISVFNHLGQLVMTVENTNEINIAALSKGIYFAQIKDGSNQVTIEKIIKI